MRMRVYCATKISALLIVFMFFMTISFIPPIYLNTPNNTENEHISSPLVDNEISPENVQLSLFDRIWIFYRPYSLIVEYSVA